MDDTQQTATDLEALAAEIRPHDAAFAVLFTRLAEAVRERRADDARGYASVIDARAAAEVLLGRRPILWGVLELLRNVLVFAPIAVTWYGLSAATDAYGRLLAAKPDLVSRPFLALWQEGFAGTASVLSFSTVALTDATLIGILIVLSLFIHFRSDVRDAAARTRVLLKESQVNALLAHATTAAARPAVDGKSADALLDQLVAEEQRIYERAMEREAQLADLAKAVDELRRAAADLAIAAAELRRGDRVAR